MDPCLYYLLTDNGFVLIGFYVDDLLVVGKNPRQVIEELKVNFGYKFRGVGGPEYFLGANIKWIPKFGNDMTVGSKTYIERSLANFAKMFPDYQQKQAKAPMEPKAKP